MSEFRDNLDRLRAAAAEFARQRELAEARVAEVNEVVQQLSEARFADSGQQVTGPVVECWEHGESDSATYNVAAIEVPQGVGVVRFDLNLGDKPDEDTLRFSSFVPFAECKPSVQAKLAPHIDSLVTDLLRVLDIAGRSAEPLNGLSSQ